MPLQPTLLDEVRRAAARGRDPADYGDAGFETVIRRNVTIERAQDGFRTIFIPRDNLFRPYDEATVQAGSSGAGSPRGKQKNRR
jgi:hypothetical protein